MDAKPLSDVQIKDLKAAFTMLDENKDGKVNVGELQRMMEMLGIQTSEEIVVHIMERASTSGDGLISEDEFLNFMSKHTSSNEEDIMEDLLAAFRVFDKSGNGYISRDELKQAMIMIGENLSDAAIDEMLRAADIDHDGRIDYEEFARMLL